MMIILIIINIELIIKFVENLLLCFSIILFILSEHLLLHVPYLSICCVHIALLQLEILNMFIS